MKHAQDHHQQQPPEEEKQEEYRRLLVTTDSIPPSTPYNSETKLRTMVSPHMDDWNIFLQNKKLIVINNHQNIGNWGGKAVQYDIWTYCIKIRTRNRTTLTLTFTIDVFVRYPRPILMEWYDLYLYLYSYSCSDYNWTILKKNILLYIILHYDIIPYYCICYCIE